MRLMARPEAGRSCDFLPELCHEFLLFFSSDSSLIFPANWSSSFRHSAVEVRQGPSSSRQGSEFFLTWASFIISFWQSRIVGKSDKDLNQKNIVTGVKCQANWYLLISIPSKITSSAARSLDQLHRVEGQIVPEQLGGGVGGRPRLEARGLGVTEWIGGQQRRGPSRAWQKLAWNLFFLFLIYIFLHVKLFVVNRTYSI